MSRDFENAITVNSVPEEYEILETIDCDCGGKFSMIQQALVENDKKFYDILTCVCQNCKKETEFIFDINSFFGKEFGL